MRKYTIIVTRDITESCVVKVEADNMAAASDKAMDLVHGSSHEWIVDDGSCGTSPAYITDISED